jgi:hypothetical protein
LSPSRILTNAVYVGDIVHKDKVFPGNHPAVIDRALWNAVQRGFQENRQGERRRTGVARPSLLAGLVVDDAGGPLIATHAVKGKVCYRYYVSRALHFGDAGDGMRFPAREFERAVIDTLATALDDPLGLAARLDLPLDAQLIQQLDQRAQATKAAVLGGDHLVVRELIERVAVQHSGIDISCSAARLAARLGRSLTGDRPALLLTRTLRLTRTGRVVRFVQTDGRPVFPVADPSLLRLVAKTHH